MNKGVNLKTVANILLQEYMLKQIDFPNDWTDTEKQSYVKVKATDILNEQKDKTIKELEKELKRINKLSKWQ